MSDVSLRRTSRGSISFAGVDGGVFSESVVDGALIPNGHAASALVVERDAQSDQFA
jgi:hypothetical protein